MIFTAVVCNSLFFFSPIPQLSMLKIILQWSSPCPVYLNQLPTLLFFITSRDLSEAVLGRLWNPLLWTKQNKQILTSNCYFLLPIKPLQSTEDSTFETQCSLEACLKRHHILNAKATEMVQENPNRWLLQANKPQEIPFIITSSDSKEMTSRKDLLPFFFSTLDIWKLFLRFAVVPT